MINLIPKEEKKKIVRNFYYRLVILLFLIGSFTFLILFVVTFPSYFLSSVRESIINTKLETQKNEVVPLLDEQTIVVMKDLNHKLSLIEEKGNDKFTISEKVINAIVLKKMPNIKITDISYENDSSSSGIGKKISIQGNAPSREVLLLFRQTLEGSTNFKQVDLPISNFVKGSDIKFYLSLIPE